jgi:hypothetical protein
VLAQNYFSSKTVSLVMKSAGDSDEINFRYLQLQMSTITFFEKEYRVATFHDLTESKKL